jgi:hypothetical protein
MIVRSSPRRCSFTMRTTRNEKKRVMTCRRVAKPGQFMASVTYNTRSQRGREAPWWFYPAPEIDTRCKWYHLLSDSKRRRTYSSVIADQQRRDRSQQGERSHRSQPGARTGILRLSHQIQSQASSTRQVEFQEVGSLSALLVLSNNLP